MNAFYITSFHISFNNWLLSTFRVVNVLRTDEVTQLHRSFSNKTVVICYPKAQGANNTDNASFYWHGLSVFIRPCFISKLFLRHPQDKCVLLHIAVSYVMWVFMFWQVRLQTQRSVVYRGTYDCLRKTVFKEVIAFCKQMFLE